MPTLTICIDCGQSVTEVRRSRCAECFRAWADRKNEADRGRKRTGSNTRARAEHQAFTTSPEWRRFAHMIRNRDGHCQRCGTTERLTVHHIVPFRQAPELAFDASNCITLCRSCHGRVERRAS